MNRIVRLVVGLTIIEGALAYLWWRLLQPDVIGRTHFIDASGPVEVSRTMGMAMGGVLGFGLFLFFVFGAAQRKKAAARARRG